ncbi:DUF6455 family protein [Nioella aestuarii]
MTHPLGDIRHHFMLSQTMAKVTGADLIHAVQAGLISQEDWADAVTRCRGCDWARSCEEWLSGQGETTVKAPSTCANAALFNQLAS